MDNVQKVNNCVNIARLQTFSSCLLVLMFESLSIAWPMKNWYVAYTGYVCVYVEWIQLPQDRV
jgi:uncharacterized membrane protein